MFIEFLDVTNTITKIERQKRNRDRFSIFLDEQYRFSVQGDLLDRYGLKTGTTLDENTIAELKKEDEKLRCKIQAFKILSRRDHSRKELADKLKQKGYSEGQIAELTEELQQKRYLDDESFAGLFARNRLLRHPVGKRRLIYELKQKGIAPELIDKTVESLYEEFDEYKIARSLMLKKIKTVKNQPGVKEKKRIADFLFRRGFNWEIIYPLLDELDVLIEE